MVENGATLPIISPIRIDLSRMIFDKMAMMLEADFYQQGLIVVFRPFESVLNELLADFYCR